jgi:anthranilate synthase/aminodeoxychorismate synthase-like glutamine amidotransferase
MVLVIDNYDSFVHNLARYIEQLGYKTAVHRNNKITIEQIDKLKPSHIILSPGPCGPDSAGICLDLIKCFAPKIPILGVCLGHQAIGQAFGGNIVRAHKVKHAKSSILNHNFKSIFKNIKNNFKVGRYHSLVLDKSSLPDCLDVNAVTLEQDGTETIMAIQHNKYPTYGVQFHPESILTEYGYDILGNFLTNTY